MSNARRQLAAIITTAQNCLLNWNRYADTIGALGTSDIPATGIGIHGGDICDPTYASVLGLEQWSEVHAEIAEALGHLRTVERRITTGAANHPETTRLLDAAAKAARCSDPVCTANAVKNGKCWLHFQHGAA